MQVLLSEEIESKSHTDARLITTDVMIDNGYEIEAGYFLDVKFKFGRQPARLLDAEIAEQYYHEVDLWCKKTFDTGLTEEVFIEFDGDDTRHEYEDSDGTVRPPLNSSKYVYKKQKGNDEDFEKWLRQCKPDAILIRINKEDILTLKDNPNDIYQLTRAKIKKSIAEFLA